MTMRTGEATTRPIGSAADRARESALRIGLDIGGTKTDAVVVDADGVPRHEVRLPTGFGADAVLDTAVDAVERLAAASGHPVTAFESVGVGIPGAVESGSGVVQHAVNLGLVGLDLGAVLAERLGRAVHVENDVNAAALGAHSLLGGSVPSMAYLNLGTGLAAGLVLDGRLRRGARGAAGEIGHIPVDPEGPPCPCGQRGCLEAVASGSAIARQWDDRSDSPVTALFAAARAGDAEAAAIRDRLTTGVASAVRILVLSVDVDRVVIGGGLSSASRELVEGVHAVLDDWSSRSPFLAMLDLPGRLHLLPRGFPAAAVGAALIGSLAVLAEGPDTRSTAERAS